MSDTEAPRLDDGTDEEVEPVADDLLIIAPEADTDAVTEPDDADPEYAQDELIIIPASEADDEGDDGFESVSAEPAADDGLLIVPGDPEEDLVIVAADSEPASESTPEIEEDEEPGPVNFTLDELVAEMADVSTVVTEGPAAGVAAPAAVERIAAIDAVMNDTVGDGVPLEGEMWTRLPFWILGGVWALAVLVLTYLLWPTAKVGLGGAPLYGALVYGGAALAVLSLAVGATIWSRARSLSTTGERPIVSRIIMMRALTWTASGVGLWVVSMIVLSFHSLAIIP